MTASAPGIDETAVERWLLEVVPGLTAPLSFERLTAGRSNITYLVVDSAGRRVVLRRPPLGTLLASAHDVTREFRIVSHLVGTGVHVAAPLALTEDPAVCAAPLAVMEFVSGIVIDNPSRAAELSSEARGATSFAMAAELAALHAVDVDAVGLADLAPPRPYAERQLRRWMRQWNASQTREEPLAQELHDRLSTIVPAQTETTVVHGDYHLQNVILAEGGGDVRAVLDWELSTLGDPLADLGALLAYWAQASDEPPIGPIQSTAMPGFATRQQLVDAYAGYSNRDVSAMPFWYALALWKIGVIMEGVRHRAIEDPGNGDIVAVELIDGLFERCAQVLDGADF